MDSNFAAHLVAGSQMAQACHLQRGLSVSCGLDLGQTAFQGPLGLILSPREWQSLGSNV